MLSIILVGVFNTIVDDSKAEGDVTGIMLTETSGK
jgi:hypothetical protein